MLKNVFFCHQFKKNDTVRKTSRLESSRFCVIFIYNVLCPKINRRVCDFKDLMVIVVKWRNKSFVGMLEYELK